MKKGQLLAQFNYNDKLFHLFLLNNKLNCLCYDSKGTPCLTLNEDEKDVIVSVVQSLTVDENRSYYVRDEKVGDNIYKIFFDPVTKNHFWKSLDNTNNFRDNVYLNMKYNHEPDIVYFNKKIEEYSEQELDNKLKNLPKDRLNELNEINGIGSNDRRLFFKKQLFLSEKKRRRKNIIDIMFLGTLIIGTLILVPTTIQVGMDTYRQVEEFLNPSVVIETTLEQKVETTTKENEFVLEVPEISEQTTIKEEYSWEKIAEAINSNSNLADIEKEFLRELKFIFDENHQYMDLDIVIARLETLSITYTSDLCPFIPDKGGTVGGTYTSSTNLIQFFETNSFADVDVRVFIHEFFHVLQIGTHVNLVAELSNETFTREAIRRLDEAGILDKYGFHILSSYCGTKDFGKGYEAWMEIWYDIAELLSQETLCKFQFQRQEALLFRGLSQNSHDYNSDVYQNAVYLISLINKSKMEPLMSNLDPEIVDEINRYINYYYELRGKNLYTTLGRNIPFKMDFDEQAYHYKLPFILNKIGKSNYLGDQMSVLSGLQRRSYYSNAFPKSILYLYIDHEDIDHEERFSIAIDENMELEYLSFVNSEKEKSK